MSYTIEINRILWLMLLNQSKIIGHLATVNASDLLPRHHSLSLLENSTNRGMTSCLSCRKGDVILMGPKKGTKAVLI